MQQKKEIVLYILMGQKMWMQTAPYSIGEQVFPKVITCFSLFFAKAISILSSSSNIANCKKNNYTFKMIEKSKNIKRVIFCSEDCCLHLHVHCSLQSKTSPVKHLLTGHPLNFPWVLLPL